MQLGRTPVLLVLFVLGFVLLIGGPLDACAQEASAAAGAIDVTVTTQSTIRLPGVLVELHTDRGQAAGRQISDGEGLVHFTGVAPGQYHLVGSLEGFQTIDVAVTVLAGAGKISTSVDMPIAVTGEQVDVVAPLPLAAETIGQSDSISATTIEQYGGVDGLQAALKLLATVITVPGGVSIKGGRPAQASTQVGSGMLVDPSTGFVRFTFPADAIDSVAVLPNPYAVEYGRFSSGLVVIRTRKAALDKWKTRVGHLEPSLHTKRHEPFTYTGLESWGPWVETGGPLIDNRLFVEQSLQYRYETTDVPSRPEDERIVTNWLSTFTRVDANLTPKQALSGTFGYFPSDRNNATLGTFTPPNAAADVDNRTGNGAITLRSVWSSSLISESSVQFQNFSIDATPHGPLPMELLPETTFGNFYNIQHRDTSTVQFIQTISTTKTGFGGLHSLKAGIDIFHTDYDGTSVSRPVLIARTDGVLTRTLDFLGPSTQSVQSTDVALFLQDRLQVNPRWLLEFGGRLDRDGIIDRVNVTPRVGAVVLLNQTGNTLIRGGYGLFYERMPSVAGAFEQFEPWVDTRYAADGVTPLGPPVLFTPHAVLGTAPPRSITWDVAFEHRFNKTWAIHTAYLDRRGANELVIQPIVTNGIGELRLDSSGRSRYQDAEISATFNTELADFTLTYVKSLARNDLNSFTNFYNVVMWPIIGANAYAPSDSDNPHRLFGRARYQPTKDWLFTGVIDWRTGFPYSVVNQYLDFVGERNVGRRFPTYFKADLGGEYHFKKLKWKPWIGVRLYNALENFIPIDVLNNVTSPGFGSFFNSEFQQIRLQIRFER